MIFMEKNFNDHKMPTYKLGSFIVNSGRMAVSAGVSVRGWKPGLSPFMNSPIISTNCKPGLWWVLQNRKEFWTDDHYVLVNSEEAFASPSEPFLFQQDLITFQTWGKLKVEDVSDCGASEIARHKFGIHPGKYQMIGCLKGFKEDGSFIDRNMNNVSLFIFRPPQPLAMKLLRNRVDDIQKDLQDMVSQY